MRSPTNPTNRRSPLLFIILACLLLVAGGCSDASSANDDEDRFSQLPTLSPDPASLATPTPAEDPTPQVPDFVSELLSPGPTLDPAQRIFFRNGRDLWVIAPDDVERALDPGTRFSAYATSPHGVRAAVVVISEENGEQAERVHIYANDALGPALTPVRITSGPQAESSIRALVWSLDATRIAILYDEPRVAILEIARPDGAAPAITTEIHLPDGYRRILHLDWATTGNGLAVLGEQANGTGTLWLASLDGELFEVATSMTGATRSLVDIAWLPGRGRIAFIEDRTAASPTTGGSMFSIAPDGTGRELLVSSGTFAPAAEIIDIEASPGGRFIAFSVGVPGSDGADRFHSAWILNIDSGEISQIPVTTGHRVTDFWWVTEGLLWRAVHRDAPVVESITSYAGVEPFVMGRFNPENGEALTVFQSAAN